MKHALFDSTGRCLQTISSSLPFSAPAGHSIMAVADDSQAAGIWLQDGEVVEREMWAGDLPAEVVEGSSISIQLPSGSWLSIRGGDAPIDLRPDDHGLVQWGPSIAGSYLVEACGRSRGAFQIEVITLAKLKANTWSTVKSRRSAIIEANISIPGIGVIQADPVSRGLIDAQAARAALIGEGFSVSWTLANNTTRAVSLADLHAFQMEIGARDDLCHRRSADLRAQIDQVGEADALRALDIAAGWPIVPGDA